MTPEERRAFFLADPADDDGEKERQRRGKLVQELLN
jgi:hypothetical protein